MASPDTLARSPLAEPGTRTAFLVIDTESVPDGRLLAAVKYPGENVGPEEAIERARAEQRETSWNGSDFIPVSFQFPVGVCVLRVGTDFALQAIACLDAPHFRPREIVKKFWLGVSCYKAKLVTFNGRRFDMPLLELAALVDAGELRPEVDSVFPLTEARAAFERVAAPGKRGKVVLEVDGG